MIPEIEEFLQRARAHKPACKERTLTLMHSKSMKELYEAATDIQGIEFLCNAIGQGWGMATADIERLFGSYINGRYIRDIDGYKTAVYCNYSGEVTVNATVMCFIDSHVTLFMPDSTLCKLYVAGDSEVRVTGGGTAFIEYQDDKSKIL